VHRGEEWAGFDSYYESGNADGARSDEKLPLRYLEVNQLMEVATRVVTLEIVNAGNSYLSYCSLPRCSSAGSSALS